MFQLGIYNAGLNAVFGCFINSAIVKGKVLKLFIRMVNVKYTTDQKMEYNI